MFNIFIYKREKKNYSHKQFCNAKLNKLVLIKNFYFLKMRYNFNYLKINIQRP